ncbi:MAG: 50S ribosomal protein L33 [Chloroflexota bacterium]|nr:50S ribosomal protein L33 [Chloroflexota bacterium]
MAKKKKSIRPSITLACTVCKEQNYLTEKNRRNDRGRLELKKYCSRCRQHTLHRETK